MDAPIKHQSLVNEANAWLTESERGDLLGLRTVEDQICVICELYEC